MKLLKYPRALHNGRIVACACVDDKLVTAGTSSVSVWPCSDLVGAAMDKTPAKEVRESFEILLSDGKSGPLKLIGGCPTQLYVSSDRAVFFANSWLEAREKSQFEPLFEVKSPACITDVQLDTSLHLMFVLVSQGVEGNYIALLSTENKREVDRIPLGASQPVTGVLDPLSQFFTVVCADRNVSVFQYSASGNFKLLNRLSHYLQVDPLRYRISMSPQADILPILNSVSGSTPAILLLDRKNGFKLKSTLVGHFDKCQAFQFSPKLYQKTLKSGAKSTYNLAASSGFDAGNIVIWNTRRLKPLLNTKCTDDSYVTDLQWTADGLALFATTNDGTLLIFAFRPEELGEVLPDNEVTKLRSQIPTLEPLPVVEKPVSRANSKANTPAQGPSGNVTKVNDKKKIAPTVIQSTSMEFNAPSYSVPKDLKRKPKDAAQQLSTKKQKHDLEPMDFLDTNLLMPSVSFSKMRLAAPKVRLSLIYKPTENEAFSLNVKNGSGNEQTPTILSLKLNESGQEKVVFEDFLPKLITICTAGENFWGCCSDDGTIYIYSDSGKKLLPPMIMGVPISFLEACGKFLLCLTSMGQLYCWDVERAALHFPPNSVYPLLSPNLRFSDDVLTRAENITMCTLTLNGVPIVTLSNGDGYMFDKAMESWMLINDSWWAYGSQYWNTTKTTIASTYADDAADKHDKKHQNWNSEAKGLSEELKENKKSILNYLESKTNDELNRKGRARALQKFAKTILMKEGYENLEEVVTLSHLENKLLVSLRLGENDEFLKLIVIYCIRLSEMGYRDRLDDVLQWLYNDGDYKVKTVAGVSAYELLKKIIVACADIRHVQRVTTSYATAIGLINESII
ncbi:Hir2p [Lachancea thermotolerans CBS 6340]|uniref:Protein HIR n=1 Tax=Lachancea thermotolerans (strain ATCC 56472 / CBS 6340 / NRRL Y-8284) TaxID=559295 RepID=C5DJJ1_LACTC|nr:KLTH0F16830p [Lachancea thermotolerans CBS 6340]CAR24480.1 KLTH0F16830p [Lachancea thermotolerans CBS 6340]